jgi:hypothetical protein
VVGRASVFISIFLLLLGSPCLSNAYMPSRGMFSQDIPQPVLKEPVTGRVDLSQKSELSFRWGSHEGDISERRYYDFRLYKGYRMTEPNLILKNNVPAGHHRFFVSADIFELNHVYTWSLRQIYRLGNSRRSSSSFIVIGK